MKNYSHFLGGALADVVIYGFTLAVCMLWSKLFVLITKWLFDIQLNTLYTFIVITLICNIKALIKYVKYRLTERKKENGTESSI